MRLSSMPSLSASMPESIRFDSVKSRIRSLSESASRKSGAGSSSVFTAQTLSPGTNPAHGVVVKL